MHPHIFILHEDTIFSSGNDGADSDKDSDDEAILIESDLCIPFGLKLFHIMKTVFL